MEEEIKELHCNIDELSLKLKEANDNIIKLDNNLLMKEDLIENNENIFKEKIYKLEIIKDKKNNK